MHLHFFHPQCVLQVKRIIISLIRWSRSLVYAIVNSSSYTECVQSGKTLFEVIVPLVHYFYLLGCWREAHKLVFQEILELKG